MISCYRENRTNQIIFNIIPWFATNKRQNDAELSCRSSLFGVAEQTDTTQNPVIRILGGLQQQREDVVEICATGFLVDRAFIQVGAASSLAVDGKDVHDRQQGVEYLRWRLHQTAVTPIPTSTIQVQTMDIHTCEERNTISLVIHV